MSQPFKMQWDPVTKSYNTSFWNADQWQEFGKNGGIVTDDGELLLKDGKVLNPYTDISAKEMHLGVEDIKWYTEPLKLDHTIYEVDYLYEGTIMNIGRPSFVPYGLNVIDKANLKYR